MTNSGTTTPSQSAPNGADPAPGDRHGSSVAETVYVVVCLITMVVVVVVWLA